MVQVSTFAEYCMRFAKLLKNKEWSAAMESIEYISARDGHVENAALNAGEQNLNLGQLRRYFGTEWAAVVEQHFQVIQCDQQIANIATDAKTAEILKQKVYDAQRQMVLTFCKEIIRKMGDNWWIPLLDQLCSDLRYTARMADLGSVGQEKDIEAAATEATSYHEKAAAPIMECYRACVSDSKGDVEHTRRLAILNLTNHLFRIYFSINKLNLLKPLIRQIEENSGNIWPYFSMADKVTYRFYMGRKAMFDAQLTDAEKFLTYAWRNCPPAYYRNRRAILIYLVPVKMFLGHMPQPALLDKYQLPEFAAIVAAVRSGNLRAFDTALETHERFFISSGLFLMLEKLKLITCRTLFKKIHKILGKHQIPLAAFECALRFMGVDDIDADEVACITANLIAQNRIKGYISHQHQVLVVSRVTAFPPLVQSTLQL